MIWGTNLLYYLSYNERYIDAKVWALPARGSILARGVPVSVSTGCWRYFKMQKTNNGQIVRNVRFDIVTDRNEEFHNLFRNESLLKRDQTLRRALFFLTR